ncbi:unnamed protein product [Spirodela intermedia]|uniref:Uncharacterized protein n=1 Tax=Spirodela intermedia TaxID=51605 RepID=A0A7I8IEB4_SPIIN|nr:unnamed protein product [Spirodela intermedia]CAA6655971.1 unnamed protein product [Spirodela intermedia]
MGQFLFSGTTTAPLLFLFCVLLANPFGGGGRVADGATFTFVNKCEFTVWPGVLSSAGSPPLGTTGFELPVGGSLAVQAPTSWSGRFWGRTGCASDPAGRVVCATGDCGSGEVKCNGAGAAPPATLAEFTLDGSSALDFYDVSLVDGYNLPLVLRAGAGEACRSACEAFGNPEYCCSGEFATPSTCRPSVYSQMFKSACPRSYSYAYDDATSTFTCSGADYLLTFCPSGATVGR